MVVAFIIPRVKSTVALRATGHLAIWLLWRTSGFLVNDASDLNLERSGQLSKSSVSLEFDAMPRRDATSGGGIRNSPVLTVVMNGFLRKVWFFFALLRCSSFSCSCSWSFFSFAFRTSLKSSVDKVILGFIAGILSTDRELSWLLLRASLLNGFTWFDCKFAWTKWSFDLLMRFRSNRLFFTFSRQSSTTDRFVSLQSFIRRRGRLVSKPSFWRMVNAGEFFRSRSKGSPLAVGANAEIPAGMLSAFSGSFTVTCTAHFPTTRYTDRVAVDFLQVSTYVRFICLAFSIFKQAVNRDQRFGSRTIDREERDDVSARTMTTNRPAIVRTCSRTGQCP